MGHWKLWDKATVWAEQSLVHNHPGCVSEALAIEPVEPAIAMGSESPCSLA